MSIINVFQKNIDNILKNNLYNNIILTVLIFYGAIIAPSLTKNNAKFFDNNLVKLLIIALMAYLSNKHLNLAILLSICYCVSLQTLYTYEYNDKLHNDLINSNNNYNPNLDDEENKNDIDNEKNKDENDDEIDKDGNVIEPKILNSEFNESNNDLPELKNTKINNELENYDYGLENYDNNLENTYSDNNQDDEMIYVEPTTSNDYEGYDEDDKYALLG